MSESTKYSSNTKASLKIGTLIGRAIREGKYLSITYKNQDDVITPFWISILDISANDELRVNMFNVTKEEPILNAKIFISRIKTAEVLKFSCYDVSEKLIYKIDHDEQLQKYEFDQYDNNLLNYYLACYNANHDPFLHKHHLIAELDLTKLLNQNPFQLSVSQQGQINKEIYHNDYKTFYQYELVLCEFSIDIESRGKYVVAYRTLEYDPVNRSLKLGEEVLFNSNFYIKDVKYCLSYYSELKPTDFETSYKENKSQTIQNLIENFRSSEIANTRPEIVVLGYEKIEISGVFERINEEANKNEMDIPLKALFRNTSLKDYSNRKEPNIVLYDNNINIDQLLTIYNSLKSPITYVQGPPGTGKTQTILNIVVNCLTNNKTLLISSNNNVPIDGIYEKLDIGSYRDKKILFPIIRLGNNKLVLAALNRIKDLYEFQTKDVPKEELLFNIKEKSKQNNQRLTDSLKSIELKIDLTQKLEFINALLSQGKTYLLDQERQKLELKLAEIPPISDESIMGTFEVIKGNHQLMQYFYYESLKYVKRLKNIEYKNLIEIIYLEDPTERVKKFNKWISEDENIELFTKTFPIILTTNISSRRLGHKFKFDLLTIDEAGQCDISSSLIPISKAKSMALIGDTNQLKPIVLIEEKKNKKLMQQYQIEAEYDYSKNSILSLYRTIDNISRNILLRTHYRCGAKIINYSNQRFYERKLKVSDLKKEGVVKLLPVNNLNQVKKNSSIEEAQSIMNYIKTNKLTDVYILTPFRNQEDVINHYLKEGIKKGEIDSSVNCGTIHKVQGQENKTIIISTAISKATKQQTYNWIKNNSELLNVGVTRAKENLIVVADRTAVDILSKKDDDLYALIDYVEKNGTTEIAQSAFNKFTIGFSNDSKFEDEFYKTMQHYCTSTENKRFKRNVKLIELFPEEKNNNSINKKEFDGVLYENNVPKIVFEINGREHYNKQDRINSDKLKAAFLKKNQIKLIFIPNHYVKHYEFIRELILKFQGDIYQKSLFDGYEPKK